MQEACSEHPWAALILQSVWCIPSRPSERPAVLANLSARVGSIGDNRPGGWHSYRASKSACNQLTKCAGGRHSGASPLAVQEQGTARRGGCLGFLRKRCS